MMKNQDNEVVGHIATCFPRFHHEQKSNMCQVFAIPIQATCPQSSSQEQTWGVQLNKLYKLCKQLKAP